jgi:hypothetical protein
LPSSATEAMMQSFNLVLAYAAQAPPVSRSENGQLDATISTNYVAIAGLGTIGGSGGARRSDVATALDV